MTNDDGSQCYEWYMFVRQYTDTTCMTLPFTTLYYLTCDEFGFQMEDIYRRWFKHQFPHFLEATCTVSQIAAKSDYLLHIMRRYMETHYGVELHRFMQFETRARNQERHHLVRHTTRLCRIIDRIFPAFDPHGFAVFDPSSCEMHIAISWRCVMDNIMDEFDKYNSEWLEHRRRYIYKNMVYILETLRAASSEKKSYIRKENEEQTREALLELERSIDSSKKKERSQRIERNVWNQHELDACVTNLNRYCQDQDLAGLKQLLGQEEIRPLDMLRWIVFVFLRSCRGSSGIAQLLRMLHTHTMGL